MIRWRKFSKVLVMESLHSTCTIALKFLKSTRYGVSILKYSLWGLYIKVLVLASLYPPLGRRWRDGGKFGSSLYRPADDKGFTQIYHRDFYHCFLEILPLTFAKSSWFACPHGDRTHSVRPGPTGVKPLRPLGGVHALSH